MQERALAMVMHSVVIGVVLYLYGTSSQTKPEVAEPVVYYSVVYISIW